MDTDLDIKTDIVEGTKAYFGITEIDGLNSPEWLEKERIIFEESEDCPGLNQLQTSWEILSEYYQPFDPREHLDGGGAISTLSHYLEAGCYPPPEVLTAISNCFSMYCIANGALTLEEVFFGPPKKGLGTHAARLYDGCEYYYFDVDVRKFRFREERDGVKKPASLADIAEFHFQELSAISDSPGDNNPPDIDSFLRGYRRWKARRDG